MNPGSALDLGNFKKQAPNLYKNIGITDQITSTGHVNMYVMGVMVNAQTKRTPAAVAFAHYVTDAEHQMSFAKQVAIFPSTIARSTTRTSPRRTAPTRHGCGSRPPSR